DGGRVDDLAAQETAADDDGWDDDIAGDDEADAFFTADDQSRRHRFGFRRGSGTDDDAAAEVSGAMEPGFEDVTGDPAGGGHAAEVLDSPRGDPYPGVPGGGPPVDEPPVIQPLSEMPLLDDGDGRLEVTPIGSSARDGAAEEPEVEDEYGEWRGEGSRIPASWFADVDEDEIEIEDMRPVDADEEPPLLEAGGMFDVGDILEPLPDPGQGLEEAGEPLAPMTGPSGYEEPRYQAPPQMAVEPPDLFDPGDEGEAPDLLGEAAALMSGETPAVSDAPLWDETAEMDSVGVPEPPPLPGGGAEPWDAPPLVAAAEPPWGTEPDVRGGIAADPPIDPNAAVYDVVEDDLDRAPAAEPPAVDPTGPLDWSEEIFGGAATMEHRDLAEAVARASTEDTQLQALSAAMPGLESGVVGFEDVEDLGTDEYYVPAPRSDLGARVLTGLILVSLLFGSLWVSGGMLAGFIGVMMMVGLTEYFTTLRHKGFAPLVIFGYLGAVGALAGTWAWGPIAIPAAIISTTVVVFFFYAFAPRRRDALVNGGLTVMGMAWITGTVAFAIPIIASEDYRVLVFALVAATVAMDVGAYGFGRAWGSAQMSPVLSPNKSIEGLAGGIVMAIGVALGIGLLMEPFDIRSGAALGLVVAVAAPLGDLAESMFKRSLGVKDMGAILPGHGGIMDRVDAFLFVIPPVWVLYQLLGYLS
ncbi:MAG: phosphatidate cytidylyltransferase, partial [Actinobacteria bacterium]|nr:phosphatidate cytidylyltransferase [Actinomycetota bacterium]